MKLNEIVEGLFDRFKKKPEETDSEKASRHKKWREKKLAKIRNKGGNLPTGSSSKSSKQKNGSDDDEIIIGMM